MAKLNEDELRDLISQTIPDAVFDDAMTRTPTPELANATQVVNRSVLARKVAAQRLGLDSHANVAALDDLDSPEPLATDQSRFIGREMRNPNGEPSVKAVVVSTETGEPIAEQG